MGWIIENCYSLVTKRVFFKPGFFLGPLKPMYGFAPVLLVSLIHPKTHGVVVMLLCLFIPTMVEYASGFLLQKFFQRQWWDYTNIPFQLHGHICLIFSVCWLFLSLLCLKVIHPAVVSLYERLETYWIWMSPAVLCYVGIELFFAIRRHSLVNNPTIHSTDPIQ